jgi:hypothetical protein
MPKRIKPITIAAFIGELIETHIADCDEEVPPGDPDHVPHICSEVHKASADIVSIGNHQAQLFLTLSDGSKFVVAVRKWMP